MARTGVWRTAGFIAGAWVLLVLIPTASAVSYNPSILFAHGLSVVQWIAVLACVGLAVLGGCAAILGAGRRWLWPANAARVEPWVAAVLVAVPVWGATDRLVGSANAVLAFGLALAGAAAVGLAMSRVGHFGLVLFTIALLTSLIGPGVILAPVATAGDDTPLLASAASDGRTNVLWVILDEAGADGLASAGGVVRDEFPALQALQRTATTYTQAYATYPYTDIAIPAMMGGRSSESRLADGSALGAMFDEGFLPQMSERFTMLVPQTDFFCRSYACWSGAETVADRVRLLAADGVAVVANAALPTPIRGLVPSTDGRVRGFWADTAEGARTDLSPFLDHWERDGGRSQPFFAIVHSYAAHHPWNMDAVGRSVMPNIVDPVGVGDAFADCVESHVPCTAGLVELQRRLYANGLREADREVGRQLAELVERGLLDTTLVIVTADHAASIALGQSARRPDSDAERARVAHVPLLVKYPGQTVPAVVTGPRSTGQVMPTVLEESGLAGAEPMAGLDQPAPADASFSYPAPGSPVGAVDGSAPVAALAGTPREPWPDSVYADAPAAVVAAPDWATVAASVTVTSGDSDLAAIVVETTDDRCRPGDGAGGLVMRGSAAVAPIEWEDELAHSGERRGWALGAVTADDVLAVRCHAAAGSQE